MRIFGCVAHRLLHPHERKKLEDKCIFIGYYDVGYRLWSVQDRKVKLARNVKFQEDRKGATLLVSHQLHNTNDAQIDLNAPNSDVSDSSFEIPITDTKESTASVSMPQGEQSALSVQVEDEQSDSNSSGCANRNRRNHRPPFYLKDYEVSGHNVGSCLHSIPNCMAEASASDDSDKWSEAAQEELHSMAKDNVWTLVEPPCNVEIILSR